MNFDIIVLNFIFDEMNQPLETLRLPNGEKSLAWWVKYCEEEQDFSCVIDAPEMHPKKSSTLPLRLLLKM